MWRICVCACEFAPVFRELIRESLPSLSFAHNFVTREKNERVYVLLMRCVPHVCVRMKNESERKKKREEKDVNIFSKLEHAEVLRKYCTRSHSHRFTATNLARNFSRRLKNEIEYGDIENK